MLIRCLYHAQLMNCCLHLTVPLVYTSTEKRELNAHAISNKKIVRVKKSHVRARLLDISLISVYEVVLKQVTFSFLS